MLRGESGINTEGEHPEESNSFDVLGNLRSEVIEVMVKTEDSSGYRPKEVFLERAHGYEKTLSSVAELVLNASESYNHVSANSFAEALAAFSSSEDPKAAIILYAEFMKWRDFETQTLEKPEPWNGRKLFDPNDLNKCESLQDVQQLLVDGYQVNEDDTTKHDVGNRLGRPDLANFIWLLRDMERGLQRFEDNEDISPYGMYILEKDQMLEKMKPFLKNMGADIGNSSGYKHRRVYRQALDTEVLINASYSTVRSGWVSSYKGKGEVEDPLSHKKYMVEGHTPDGTPEMILKEGYYTMSEVTED